MCWKGLSKLFNVNMLRKLYRKKPLVYKVICFFLSKIINIVYTANILIVTGLVGSLCIFALNSNLYTSYYFIIAIVILFLLFSLSKLIFLKSKNPKGLYLKEDRFEKLWEVVDELTKEFKGVDIEDIIITNKCNVEIITKYSFGIWGARKNILMIGLPVMLGFNEKELMKIIALTICRNSKKHKRYYKSILRSYSKLDILFNKEKKLIKTNFAFNIFTGFILKKYYLYYKDAVAMSIADIFIASDKMFLKMYDEEDLAKIILKKYVHKYLIEKVFVKDINRAYDTYLPPPKNIFNLMNKYLNENVSTRDIKRALKEFDNYDEKDILHKGTPPYRVKRIKYNIDEFQYEFGDNSARFLGKDFEKVLTKFSFKWYKDNKSIWELEMKKKVEEIKIYNKLFEEFSNYTLKESDFERYLLFREKYSGIGTAIVEGKKLCIAYPKNGDIRFLLGKLLLKGNNIQGIDYIKSGVALNPFITIEGYREIISYCIRKGENKLASQYKKEYKKIKGDYKLAIKERRKPKLKKANYEKIDSNDEKAVHIKGILKNKDYIKSAYISKVRVKKFRNVPHYILWLDYKTNFFTLEYKLFKKDQKIEKDISTKNVTVVHLNGDNFYMKLPIKKIKKQKILSKAK